jgi:hypothetical protein
MTRSDALNGWEKAALFTVGSASAFNVLLWALGYHLADAAPAPTPLGVARVIFGLVSFVGLDLTITVTVMAQRDGRRSVWAWLTATAAMLAAGGMGLEVASVVAWPWLHAAPVVVLFAFMHHLAAPRVAQRAETLAQQLAEAEAEAAQADAELAQARRELLRVPDLLAQRDDELAQTTEDLAQVSANLAQARAALAQALAHPQIADGAETLTVGARTISLRQLATVTGVAESTLRRKLSDAGSSRN